MIRYINIKSDISVFSIYRVISNVDSRLLWRMSHIFPYSIVLPSPVMSSYWGRT